MMSFTRILLLALLCALFFASTSALRGDSDVDVDVDIDVEHHTELDSEVDMEHGFELEVEQAPDAPAPTADAPPAPTPDAPAPTPDAPAPTADAPAPTVDAPAPTTPDASATATGPAPTESPAALKSNRTYVALTKSIKLTEDNVKCLINLTPNKVNVVAIKAWSKKGIDSNYTTNVATLTAAATKENVQVKVHTIFKPSGFKTEKDALDQVTRFIDATKADGSRRVWVKVGGKAWRNAPKNIKKFSLLSKIVTAFDKQLTATAGTTKKRSVGIMTSNKAWKSIMGQNTKGGTLKKYKLWLIKSKKNKNGKANKGPNGVKGKLNKLLNRKNGPAAAKGKKNGKSAKKTNAVAPAAKKASFLEMFIAPTVKPNAAKVNAKKPNTAGKRPNTKGKKGPNGKKGKKSKRFDKAWRPTVRTFRGKKAPAGGFCSIRGVRLGMSKERKQKKNGKKGTSGARKNKKRTLTKKINKGLNQVKRNIKRAINKAKPAGPKKF